MNKDNIVNDASMEKLSIHAKEILLEKNPFKNFKIENYRYAQLHKNIKPHTNILNTSLNDDLTQLTTDISNNIFTEIDLTPTIDNWEFSNSDSFFRVSSLVKRSSISINLDNFKETSLFINISNIPKNITIKYKTTSSIQFSKSLFNSTTSIK